MKAVTVLVLLAVGAILGFIASRSAARGSPGEPGPGETGDASFYRQLLPDPAELAAEILYRAQWADPGADIMPGSEPDDGWPEQSAR
jgi:hypothetical protein